MSKNKEETLILTCSLYRGLQDSAFIVVIRSSLSESKFVCWQNIALRVKYLADKVSLLGKYLASN